MAEYNDEGFAARSPGEWRRLSPRSVAKRESTFGMQQTRDELQRDATLVNAPHPSAQHTFA